MKAIKWVLMLAIFAMMSSSAQAAKEAAAPADVDPAMMEKMKTLMAPGEAHQALAAFEGKWNYTGKFWMAPGAPAQDMTGTTENKMIFGGRFLQQNIEGPWMGETFYGIGYTGYDNIKKEYESVWIDSMSTGLMKTSGKYDATTKTLSQSGANSCPLTGETDRKGRSEWTIVDANHHTYSSYLVGPDGKEFKAMEIHYVRV